MKVNLTRGHPICHIHNQVFYSVGRLLPITYRFVMILYCFYCTLHEINRREFHRVSLTVISSKCNSIYYLEEVGKKGSYKIANIDSSIFLVKSAILFLTLALVVLVAFLIIHHMCDPPVCGIFFYRILPGFDA